MKLRVGIVGLGRAWESRHKPALRALAERYEVRAVCDQSACRAQRAAEEFGAAEVDGYYALARRSDVDAVLILAHQWYGTLPVMAACDAGKAVYCDAAWDLSSAELERMRRRVDASGVAFMAEFPRRHAPATIRLKELIATKLGRPRMLFCHERSVRDNKPDSRVYCRPVDRTLNDLVELADWCCFLVDADPTSLQAVAHIRERPEAGPDYEMMSLSFSSAGQPQSGPLAQISSGHYFPSTWPEAVGFRPPAKIQIVCEHGIAFADLPTTLVWFDEAGRRLEPLETDRSAHEQMLLQFHRDVTSLVRNPRGMREAYRAVRIGLAARQSWHQGCRVDLSSAF